MNGTRAVLAIYLNQEDPRIDDLLEEGQDDGGDNPVQADCPSCEAIRNVSMGNCRLAATATTLEPRFAMSRSPAASARTTSAPLSKRRHSMRSPVARSNVPSTMPDFAGSTPVT